MRSIIIFVLFVVAQIWSSISFSADSPLDRFCGASLTGSFDGKEVLLNICYGIQTEEFLHEQGKVIRTLEDKYDDTDKLKLDPAWVAVNQFFSINSPRTGFAVIVSNNNVTAVNIRFKLVTGLRAVVVPEYQRLPPRLIYADADPSYPTPEYAYSVRDNLVSQLTNTKKFKEDDIILTAPPAALTVFGIQAGDPGTDHNSKDIFPVLLLPFNADLTTSEGFKRVYKVGFVSFRGY